MNKSNKMTSPTKTRLIVYGLLAIGILAYFFVLNPFNIRFNKKADLQQCVQNLRMIDGAKEQHAMRSSYCDGLLLPEWPVLQFCVDRKLPVCPSGGKYSLNPLGVRPVCSFHGDILDPSIEVTYTHNTPPFLIAKLINSFRSANLLLSSIDCDQTGSSIYVYFYDSNTTVIAKEVVQKMDISDQQRNSIELHYR